MARCVALRPVSRENIRPASTVAGPQPYAPAVALNDQPVAVVLDLMKSSGGDPDRGIKLPPSSARRPHAGECSQQSVHLLITLAGAGTSHAGR